MPASHFAASLLSSRWQKCDVWRASDFKHQKLDQNVILKLEKQARSRVVIGLRGSIPTQHPGHPRADRGQFCLRGLCRYGDWLVRDEMAGGKRNRHLEPIPAMERPFPLQVTGHDDDRMFRRLR